MFAPGMLQPILSANLLHAPFFKMFEPKLTRPFVRPGQEQLSQQDLKTAEVEACQTVRNAVFGGILLYLSPFAVDFAKKFL
ncbi:hypothetical protein N7454_004195 [Penicillium verhagenii]|nr:hypothetical protein N7454_004195 [Penicillium verhagenii]